MRIHSDNLLPSDFHNAARVARVAFTRFSTHGSRSHAAAYEVILTGESRRRQNGGSDYAATWDQWGVFFDALYKVDPNLKCYAYKDAGDFDFKTKNRFQNGWPDDAHGDHTFRFAGIPYNQSCTKCSAGVRWDS